MSKRVQMNVPDEVLDLFNWMVRYDERFKGKEAQVVAHFFAKGIQDAYEESLRNAEPMDADTFTVTAEHAHETMKKAG